MHLIAACLGKRLRETRQLLCPSGFSESGMPKDKAPVEGLSHKIGLSHAPPSVDSDKLRFVGSVGILEPSRLFQSSYHVSISFMQPHYSRL